MFSTPYGTYFSFEVHFEVSSAICFNLDQSKIFLSGNGLITLYIFRESRSHCVDLETAYKQGCQKLDDMMQVGFIFFLPFPK